MDARDDDEPLSAVNRATELEAGFAALETAFAAIAEELEQTVQPAQDLGEQIREDLEPFAMIIERVERSFAPLQELEVVRAVAAAPSSSVPVPCRARSPRPSSAPGDETLPCDPQHERRPGSKTLRR